MSKRAFSRSFDIPTIYPDKEDEMFEEGETIMLREYFATILDNKCPVVAKSGCDHSWTSYTGLSESFEFCKHCDEKR